MIGLDTGHLVYNYGTKLQAYAMQSLLEQSGDSVEIIQWHQKDFKILNNVSDYVKRLKKITKGYGVKYWKPIYRRYQTLDSFNKKFHIKKFYGTFEEMREKTKRYDIVFCGSDQAWLPSNVVRHWYTLEYCEKETFKAAYAPSFGLDTIEEKYTKQFQEFLSKMDALSVREVSGQKIIKDLIGKDVPVVLDPTLLLTKADWDKLKQEAKTEVKEKYIFCYFLGANQAHRDAVKEMSDKNKLKIVNLAHFSGFCKADEKFADYDLYDVSPQDFISLIANAEMVCTDSFHCTAFSIQYHKEFTVFHRFKSKDKTSTNTRLYSLLGQLGLAHRIVADGDCVIDEKIDYSYVEEKLALLRKESKEYMKNALEKKSNV